MDTPQIKQEVRRAARGDEEAAALLFDHYHPRLFKYALARLGNAQDAEDVAAETFARVLRDLDRFRWRGAGFDAWLFRIAHNLVMDTFRRQAKVTVDDEIETEQMDLVTPEAVFLHSELSDELGEMLRHLSPEQRDVIALRFAAGLDTNETAAALGKKVNAVRQLQFRALENLRQRISA